MLAQRQHRRTDRPHRDLPMGAVLAAIETTELAIAHVEDRPDAYDFPDDTLAFARLLLAEYEAERDIRERLRSRGLAPPRREPGDLAELKRVVDLVDFVNRWTDAGVRRRGRQWRGRCPLHRGERDDDLAVDPAKGVWHCFGCLAGGTVVDLALDLFALSTVGQAIDAVRLDAGLPRRSPSGTSTPAGRPRLRVREVGRA